MSSPSEQERLVYAMEDLTEKLEDVHTEMQMLSDGLFHNEYVPPENGTEAPEVPAADAMTGTADKSDTSPKAILQRHMTKNGVPTHLVGFDDTDKREDTVYFKEQFTEMDTEQVEAFRSYTMEMDHVEVAQWVEENGNTFPDGFVVDYEDIEELEA